MLYIRKALNVMESVSCLKFVLRTDEEDYIEVRVRDSNLQFDFDLYKFTYFRAKEMDVTQT